jgi:hypothetical protein
VVGRDAAVVRADRAGVDHVLGHLVDRARSEEPHVHLELVLGRQKGQVRYERVMTSLTCGTPHLKDLEGMADARFAIRAVGKDQRPTDADRLGTQSNCLENVGRPPDAAVDIDLELGRVPELAGLELADDLDEDLEARPRKVELAAAVRRSMGQQVQGERMYVVVDVPVVAEDDTGKTSLGGHHSVLNRVIVQDVSIVASIT